MFLEVDLVLPAKIMHDIMEQIEEVGAHPLQYHLLKRGLYPGHRRYRQNFEALYKFNCGARQAATHQRHPPEPAPGVAAPRATVTHSVLLPSMQYAATGALDEFANSTHPASLQAAEHYGTLLCQCTAWPQVHMIMQSMHGPHDRGLHQHVP